MACRHECASVIASDMRPLGSISTASGEVTQTAQENTRKKERLEVDFIVGDGLLVNCSVMDPQLPYD